MRNHHLEPAATVVRILDGTKNTATAAKIDRSQVYRWMLPKEQGGTGGLVPSWHHQPLLDWARDNNKPLRKADFFVSNARKSERRSSAVAA